MKIKMTTSAVTDKTVYYHSTVYEVGVNIDEKTANNYLKANFAMLVKESTKEKKAPQEKKTRSKVKANEN